MSVRRAILPIVRRGDLGPWPCAWHHFTWRPVSPQTRVPLGDPYCRIHTSLTVADVHDLARTHGPMVALEAWQDGRCALCGGEVPLRWTVADHSHDTGWVRGLLCMSCNTLQSHGPRNARYPDQGLALDRYLVHPPTLLLGLHIQYRDIRARWRRACAVRHQTELDHMRAELEAQEALCAARRRVAASERPTARPEGRRRVGDTAGVESAPAVRETSD